MPNALAEQSSPYLRQHADNPVNWVAWSPAAFAEAKRRDVPVLVSLGYSTCHWCHVMAHESFEDGSTASLMNANFVCIKVDREEHPEVDAIYMDAVQALTGHGGWPLNAFTDHSGQPFYACTYLPTQNWQQLLQHLTQLWHTQREKITDAAERLTEHLRQEQSTVGNLTPDVWKQLQRGLERSFDKQHPAYTYGQNQAPKFPSSQLLPLLLATTRPAWREQAQLVLEAMQDAGIHDRVGGGFHRYSVDREWRLPHFEKMLYDNAQLITTYAHAERADFLRTAVNAGDYLLRDMRVEANGKFVGYAAAEDADDPGGEGSFYAWSPAQLSAALGEPIGAEIAAQWDIHTGQAEVGHSGHLEPVLSHIPHPRGRRDKKNIAAERETWEKYYPTMREIRAPRPRPGRDDKVLTDQNGLALEAFAALSRFCKEDRFTTATRELATLIQQRHTSNGLMRTEQLPAFITDYGSSVTGLIAAFNCLGDPALINRAVAICDEAIQRLQAEDGGFYVTPAGRADLIRRGREPLDNAWPAGQNALALGCSHLWTITGDTKWRSVCEKIIASSANIAMQAPTACATLLHAYLTLTRGALTAVVIGREQETVELLNACRSSTITNLAIIPVATCREQTWECLSGRREISQPQVLICHGTTCLLPATTPDAVRERLASVQAGWDV
jgi:uncharacterized protein